MKCREQIEQAGNEDGTREKRTCVPKVFHGLHA
eukprot:COSAG01_NODE_30936_length_606_cov_12.745562_1_plen_32_part_10